MNKKVIISLVVVLFLVFMAMEYTKSNDTKTTTKTTTTAAGPKVQVLTDGRLLQDINFTVTRQQYAITIIRYRYFGLQLPSADVAAEVQIRRNSTKNGWEWVNTGFRIRYGNVNRAATAKFKGAADRSTRRYDIVMTGLPTNYLFGSNAQLGAVSLEVRIPGGTFLTTPIPVLPENTVLPSTATAAPVAPARPATPATTPVPTS